MKKALIAVMVILTLLSVLFISGCDKNNETPDTADPGNAENKDVNKDLDDHKAELVKFLSETDKYNAPIGELTSYSYDDFRLRMTQRIMPWKEDKALYSTSSFNFQYLNHYYNEYPIQSLKVMDDEHLLATYKLDKNGTTIYAYIVFVKESQNTVYWGCRGEYYFSKTPEAEELFLKLKEGDVVSPEYYEKCEIYDQTKIPNIEDDTVFEWTEYCLAKGGIYAITLKTDKQNGGSATVTEKVFYAYADGYNESAGISILRNGSVVELP